MVSFDKEFNADKAPERNQPLPAGDYLVVIKSTEKKDTKNPKPGTKSAYLEVRLTIVDGPQKNRLLFCRINYWNPNSIARTIAEAELGELCKAAGVPVLKDTAQLHGKIIAVSVVVEQRKDQNGNPRKDNKIVKFLPKTKLKQSKPAKRKTELTVPDDTDTVANDELQEQHEFFGESSDLEEEVEEVAEEEFETEEDAPWK